jgi:hypothetical protein
MGIRQNIETMSYPLEKDVHVNANSTKKNFLSATPMDII